MLLIRIFWDWFQRWVVWTLVVIWLVWWYGNGKRKP